MPDEATTTTVPAVAAAAGDAVEPFPAGSRVFHIGPPKTGTTALQASMWRARDALLEQGVRYAGGQQHAAVVARAVTGHKTITGNRKEVPSIRWWHALLRELERAQEPRVVYSSEALAEADDDAIRRIAKDVGPGLQVLITLRPIDAILPSQWQQSIQSGTEFTFDEWLRRMVGGPERAERNPRAYRVFRQGELASRWAAVVGRERVTVIVLDRGDPEFLFRSAESLLALRPGTLQPVDDQANRSLSFAEAEVIRQMNVQARAAGLGDGARSALITTGAAAAVKRGPAADGSGKVRLPAWAQARAVELGEATHAALLASGIRILGDPATLVPAAPEPGAVDERHGEGPILVDAETAATIAMGVAWGTGLRLGPSQPVAPRPLALTFVPVRELGRQVVRRGVAWVSRRRKLAGLGD